MSRKKGRYQGSDQGVSAAVDTDAAGEDELSPAPFRDGLSEIISKREKDFEEESGQVLEDPENIEEQEKPEKEAAGGTEEGPPVPEPEKPAEPKPAPEAPTDDEQIELVIDGEKVKKTRSEVLEIGKRAAQKELAADKRLEEAARMKREIEAERQQLQAQRIQAPPEPQAPPAKPDEPLVDYEKAVADKRKALREAMNFGEEDDQEKAQIEYEEALAAKFAAGRQQATPPIDPDTLAETIEIRMSHKTIQRQFTAPAESGGFGDLWDNPEWKSAVVQEVDRSIQAGASGTDWKTYEQAGKKVRAYREFLKTYDGGPSPAAPATHSQDKSSATVDPTLSNRADRKRQVPHVPTASGKAAVQDDDEDESPAEVVAKMAKARGQVI